MKLRCVELQGFKSFTDKTKISFESGLTAIIGPNGSGKSNISDAIRWVLGEMSLKSLRGSKMEDVIFNGTLKRPPSNYAYVSLFLDTSTEFFQKNNKNEQENSKLDSDTLDEQIVRHIHLYDEKEFVITRRYYRSGESEYYINKKQVRLKDVYELFYDTGIGREGYSVIGQGKIAEVLSGKDDERRSIFEEAAGISKFRYKKSEAERKLCETENNLLRVNDILGEIASRVAPLEKEAENAKKFLLMNEEKRALEITLWLERTDSIRKTLSQSKDTLASEKLELELADDNIKRLDIKSENFAVQGYEILQKKAEIDKKISETEVECAALQGNIAVLENDIAHSSDNHQKSTNKIIQFQAETDANKALLEAAKNELAKILDTQKVNAEKISAATEHYLTAEKKCQALSSKENAAYEEYAVSFAKTAELNTSLARFEEQLASAEKSKADYGERLKTSRQRTAELKNILTNLDSQIELISATQNSKKRDINSRYEKTALLETQKFELDEKIQKAKIIAASLEQKRENLIRLDRLFEGYSEAVKTVMSHGASGKITKNGSNIAICGTVATLFSTEGEYVVALEIALGASAQFVVVETESDAKTAIDYLKKINGGRATFLPLDTLRGRKSDISDIKNMDGFVGVASELVICDKRFLTVADELLGRTVIAEDMEKASKIAKKCGYRIKIVTKDGQIINAGGSFTGGSLAQKVGVFTRSMDIERLDKDIKSKNSELLELETKRYKLKNESDQIFAQIKIYEQEYEKESAVLADFKNQKSGTAARFDEESEKLVSLEESNENDDFERQKIAELLEELKAKKINAISDATEKKSAADNLKIMSAEMRREANLENDAVGALKLDEVRFSAVAESKKTYILSIESKLNELETQIFTLRDNEKNSAETARLCTQKILENTLQKENKQATIKQLSAERLELETKINLREQTATLMRSEQKAAALKKEQCFIAFTSLEGRLKSANDEFDSLAAKLWDEYELTYSSAEQYRLPPEKMIKAPSKVAYLKNQIRALGVINVNAVDEYAEIKQRYDFLTKQTDDLNKTRRSLDNIILKLNATMKTTFLQTFAALDTAFSEVFLELFGGGQAKITLADPENPLECGIDIIIRPPGKSIKSISLLSGGEQSFAAIALYLALQKINPAPFCIFDEIESALDDVNLIRFVDYVKTQCEHTQYIMITHRRGTMERADTLYGVTMHEKGVSDYIRLDMSKLEEKLDEYVK